MLIRTELLEKLYEEGKVRAIGVSNFHKHHLELLLPNCKSEADGKPSGTSSDVDAI